VIFSSNIIKTLESSRDGAYQKKEERRKKKVQESLQIKEEVNISRGENTSTSKIFFDVILFSPPPSYYFKNPFQNY
jgi:hypothetical protein